MSYQKFTGFGCPAAAPAANAAKPVAEKQCARAAPAANAAPAPLAATAAAAAPLHLPEQKKKVSCLADILALPIRPCTTCRKLEWRTYEYERDGELRTGRKRSCPHYQSLVDPRKGCRCVYYEVLP